MLSPNQARALRGVISAALSRNLPASVQSIPDARVMWGPVDHVGSREPWCALQVIAAEVQDADGERMRLDGADVDGYTAGELVEVVRRTYDVTVSVQLATAISDSAPSLSHNAWILARRLLVRLETSQARDALTEAGVGLERIGGIRDLTALTGPQWVSRVALDLVVRIAVLDTDAPGWIETFSGDGTLSDGGEVVLAVPYEATREV